MVFRVNSHEITFATAVYLPSLLIFRYMEPKHKATG